MKKLGKLKWLWSLAAVLLLLGGMTACSSDDDDGSETPTPTPVPTPTPEQTVTLEVGEGKTYTTVQSALDKLMADSVTGTATVKVAPGTYEEMIFYTGSATVILEGTGTAAYGSDVIIKANNSGNSDAMKDLANSHGVTSGYFRGATRFNGTCNLVLKNLTIQNTYSRSANDGSGTQAEALVFSSTGKLIAYNCSFLGHQDTLYIGSQGNRSWFYKCQIKGDVDFIWGYADVALYEECDIWAIGDDNKYTDTLSASRAMVENVEANKGIVIMNSTVHIADGVTLTFARNSGADTTAAFFNNVFLSDGDAKTGKIAEAIYGAKPNYEVRDVNGDMVIGWMDGKNYTDAAKTTLVDTTKRLEGTGALTDRYINREYSGRYVILNRGWNFTDKQFKTASSIWDISAYETEFNATADASKEQIFVEPVAAQKLVSGESVTLKAYDIAGNDITSSVEWSQTEKSNVTENKGTIVKSLTAGVLETNKTSDTAVVNGTVTVTVKKGDFTDTAYIYVIPVYIKADTVTLASNEGSVAQGNSIAITGKISFSGDANAEVSDTTTVWKLADSTVAAIFDKTNNKLLDEYKATTCDAVIYGIKAGSTTITATSADGGTATYDLTVTDSTVYYLPTFAGVYVNTDVQNGKYGVWNGVLIDAVTADKKNGSTRAKMGLKQGNARMQTRYVILNVPVTSDATIKVTLETAPVKVASAATASTLEYNGLYADGEKIVYTGATYTDKDGDGTTSITEAEYKALSEADQGKYIVKDKPYYTIGFDFETQAQTASLTDVSSLTTQQTGIDTKDLNTLTEAKWCQIGPFGSSDVYITEIAITPEASDKYSYTAAAGAEGAYNLYDTSVAKGTAIADGPSADGYVSWTGLTSNGNEYSYTSASSTLSVVVDGACAITMKDTYAGTNKKTLTVTDAAGNKLVDAATTSLNTYSFIYTGSAKTTLTFAFSGMMYLGTLDVAYAKGLANSISSVTLSGDEAVAVGANITLNAAVTPAYINTDANTIDTTAVWESKDTAVATVADGVVTGVKDGTVVIKASCGGKSAEKEIVVGNVSAVKHDLGEKYSTWLTSTGGQMNAGDTRKYGTLVLTAGEGGNFKYDSSNACLTTYNPTIKIPVTGDCKITVTAHTYNSQYVRVAGAELEYDTSTGKAVGTYTYTGDAGYVNLTASETNQCLYLYSIVVDPVDTSWNLGEKYSTWLTSTGGQMNAGDTRKYGTLVLTAGEGGNFKYDSSNACLTTYNPTIKIPVTGDCKITVTAHTYNSQYVRVAGAELEYDTSTGKAVGTYTYTGDAGYVNLTASETNQCLYLYKIEVAY